MIRGGHIDVAVLGAMQVSERGDLANWMLPQRGIGNVGGAMDLAAGARRIIVAMEHTDRSGSPKIVTQCSFPLTAPRCVSLIVTDIAVMAVGEDGLTLIEVAPGWTAQDVQELTEPSLSISPRPARHGIVTDDEPIRAAMPRLSRKSSPCRSSVPVSACRTPL